jgi:GNAT superfamily N-acetyltransferase
VLKSVIIRAFEEADADSVQHLFIKAYQTIEPPPRLVRVLQDYLRIGLEEEVSRISEYYFAQNGGFWVIDGIGCGLAGMFGLVLSTPTVMQLRRLCVAPELRRQGIARAMLAFAEAECRRRNVSRLQLETSELNHEALAVYRAVGYDLECETIVETVGGPARVFLYAKQVARHES